MTFRRAARTDDNQNDVVKALRAAGCETLSLAALGNGAPDLLVRLPGTRTVVLVEVKDGAKSPSRQRLTLLQEGFHARWPVHVVNSEDEALALLKPQGPALLCERCFENMRVAGGK